MASFGQVFDVDNLPKGDGYKPIPAGWYTASIKSADVKPTKDDTGQYINFGFSIQGPTNAGRMIFGIINIRNKNPEAERIGLQQFGDIIRAVGLKRVQDTDELMGQTLEIKVSIDPAKDGYDERNNVKGFKASEGSALPGTKKEGSPFGQKGPGW